MRPRYANEHTHDPRVELADGEYMRIRGEREGVRSSHLITVAMIERRFRLKAGQLANYRANTYSRRRRPA